MKVDSAIQSLRKAITDYKLSERSALYPPPPATPPPAKSPTPADTPTSDVLNNIDFTSRNAYSVLQIALERASSSFNDALLKVKDIFGGPMTASDRRLGKPKDEEDDDDDEPFDFKNRMNINEAAVSVARQAEKLVSVVQHALAYRNVLVEKEDDLDRKVASLVG